MYPEKTTVLPIQPATGCYSRSNELLNCRSNELLNCRSNGLLNSRSNGLLNSHYWAGSGERQLSELTGQKSELKQK
jgi:hypothetical protein